MASINGRHLARRNAVQALYQWDITKQSADAITKNFIYDERLTSKHKEYFHKLIVSIPLRIDTIDEVIEKQMTRTLAQVDVLEKAILRVGAYELIYEIDVPRSVIMNESIELAKLFCAEQGYKFVNGVLDKVSAALDSSITDRPKGV